MYISSKYNSRGSDTFGRCEKQNLFDARLIVEARSRLAEILQ